jgi:hypothetical protein
MSNRSASAVDDELVKALDPTQDAQVVQWDNVTAHIEGQQITFVTGSATLVPRDDESTRDGFDEPVASSAEVVSASSPSDCLAPMKEQPPRTPVQSPKKCGGFSQLRRSDSLVDSRNPYLQGCGGRLDFGPDNEAQSTTESVLGKRNSNSDTASDSSKKRTRTVQELEEQLARMIEYANSLEDLHANYVRKQEERQRIDYKWAAEASAHNRRFEQATASVLFSLFESFPAGPARVDWLAHNIKDLRFLAEHTQCEDDLTALLQEDDVHSDHDDDDDDEAAADADAN